MSLLFLPTLSITTIRYPFTKPALQMLLFKLIESLDEIHNCLLRILMWNYQSKVNYLCVKLRVHFRVLECMRFEVFTVVFTVDPPRS